MSADLVRVAAATAAPVLLVAVLGWLFAELTVNDPLPVLPPAPLDPAVEAERRRLRLLAWAAGFPPPVAIARVPYVASGRAGLVDLEQDTVSLVPAGWSR